VTGESHIRAKRRNDDAWRASESGTGVVVAVADGVGSVPHGRLGARAAVAAAHSVARRWLDRELGADAVPGEVTGDWSDAIGQQDPADCATTLLFGAVRNDGCVLLAWLGDGLVQAEIGGTSWGSLDAEHGWGLTPALRSADVDGRWCLQQIRGFRSGDGLVLATDGVSEDLVPGSVPRLLSKIRAAIKRDGCERVERQLRADLEAWRTPGRRDDRTMALLLGIPS
jgi:hypothetical protein